jgi:hypothetical protein
VCTIVSGWRYRVTWTNLKTGDQGHGCWFPQSQLYIVQSHIDAGNLEYRGSSIHRAEAEIFTGAKLLHTNEDMPIGDNLNQLVEDLRDLRRVTWREYSSREDEPDFEWWTEQRIEAIADLVLALAERVTEKETTNGR